MTTRIRDENTIHAPGHGRKMKKGNENTSSITRPTLASSAKAKPELKPKGSRTVLAPLAKTNPNATPRSNTKSDNDNADKPKPLTSKVAVKSSMSTLQTPKPVKKVLPKSIKKTINVYTPARTRAIKDRGEGDDEVEFSHPKPPGLEDGPPTPIRDAFNATPQMIEGDIPPPAEEIVWEDDFGLHLDNPVSPSRPLS